MFGAKSSQLLQASKRTVDGVLVTYAGKLSTLNMKNSVILLMCKSTKLKYNRQNFNSPPACKAISCFLRP
jgi:hypothetical protein